MTARSPLQVILITDENHADSRRYEAAVAQALHGGKDAAGYLPSCDDLGIQFRTYSGTLPAEAPGDMKTHFRHTLVAVLWTNSLATGAASAALRMWLDEFAGLVVADAGAHRLLPVGFDEESLVAVRSNYPKLGRIQTELTIALGEYALRPAVLGLRVMHEARLLLVPPEKGTGGFPLGFMRLFISHAKLDGLPLARALRHQLSELAWLKAFYDAEDLPAGCDWQAELQRGAGSSIVVMLRTDHYDGRYWCQQEVLWSDEYATPAVLVEARVGLNYPAATLPFERVPTVRIPDGNILRIVFLAVREGLRFLLFMERIEEMKERGEIAAGTALRAFSIAPSMAALLRACQGLKTETVPKMIMLPDGMLRPGYFEAASALVDRYAPGTDLLTPLMLAARNAKP